MNRNDPMSGNYAFDEPLPPDLESIGAALDNLAADDRARVPAGLAARIHRATLPNLQGKAEDPVVYSFAAPRSSSRGLAMAATLALFATIGAVWLAGRHQPTTGGSPVTVATISETDVDAWLALAGVSEASGSTSLDPLDEIAADAEALSKAVTDSWTHDALFNSDMTTEGSL